MIPRRTSRPVTLIETPTPQLTETTVTTNTASGGSASETPQYVYGTAVDNSDAGAYLHDEGLVRAVIYPDSTNTFTPDGSGGGTISGTYDRVEYAYNRQGEVTSMTDQNGTVHTYTYDNFGREIADKATVAQGNPAAIDTSVMEIDYTYDVYGDLQDVASKDGNGAVVSEVYMRYNDFGQMTDEYQKHTAGAITLGSNGVPTDGTPDTQYAYDAAHGYRLQSIVYPNGRTITYNYDGDNNNLNRLTFDPVQHGRRQRKHADQLQLSRPRHDRQGDFGGAADQSRLHQRESRLRRAEPVRAGGRSDLERLRHRRHAGRVRLRLRSVGQRRQPAQHSEHVLERDL